jgi:hypothetical protein
MCCKAEQHIKHTAVRCTTLAPSEHTYRYSKVAGYIHWTICKHMGLQVTNKYYKHMPARAINVNVNGTASMWE